MSKHGGDQYITDEEHHALIALAWHDVVCPERTECATRPEHAVAQPIVQSGHLERFLNRLSELEVDAA